MPTLGEGLFGEGNFGQKLRRAGGFPSPKRFPSPTAFPGAEQAVEIDVALPYEVGGYADVDIALPYTVAGQLSVDVALSYIVIEELDVDVELPYSVLGRIEVDVALPYAVSLLPHLAQTGPELTVELCDLAGNRLHNIEQRLSLTVELGLNAGRSAQLSFSAEERAATEVAPLARLLRIYMDGFPLFTGHVYAPKWKDDVVEIKAFDVTQRLATSFVGQRADGLPFRRWLGCCNARYPYRLTNEDQSWIMLQLLTQAMTPAGQVARGIPALGVSQGSLALHTRRRLREYEYGQPVLQAIVDLSEATEGLDFEFEPLGDPVGAWPNVNHWRFNTFFPYKGRDRKLWVRFEDGTGLDNCAEFAYEPDGMIARNWAVFSGQAVEGQPPARVLSSQPESQVLYGLLPEHQALSDVTYATTLKELSDEYVGSVAFPPDIFEITPAQPGGAGYRRDHTTGQLQKSPRQFGRTYIFGPDPALHDFWLGDEISAVTRQGRQPDGSFALDKQLAGRVTDATIEEADDGDVVSKITCAPTVTLTGVV